MLVNTNEDNLINLQLMLESMQHSAAAISSSMQEIMGRVKITQLAWAHHMPTHTAILTKSQAEQLDLLQKQIILLRKIAIQLDVQNGLSGRDVAHNYNVTQSRVSQVCSTPVSWQPIDQ